MNAHPDLWKNGITIKEASELDIAGFDEAGFNADGRKYLGLKDNATPYDDARLRSIWLNIQNKDGQMKEMGVNDDGEELFDPEAVLDCFRISEKYRKEDIDQSFSTIKLGLRENLTSIDTIKNIYKESISIRKWLKNPNWTLSDFVTLMLGKSPSMHGQELFIEEAPWEAQDDFGIMGNNTEAGELLDEMHQLLQNYTGAVSAADANGFYKPSYLIKWSIEMGYALPDYLLALQDKDDASATQGKKSEALTPDNMHYSQELAIANECWQALFVDGIYHPNKKAPKKQINEWLKVKHTELSNSARDRITSVVLPTSLKKGGAPRS